MRIPRIFIPSMQADVSISSIKGVFITVLSEVWHLHFFHQLKPPLLLYVRVLFMIHLAQKHPLLPNPKRIIPVKPAVNHIFFLGFRMKSHILNNIVLVLKMLIYSVNFYFSFFHYFVPPNSSVTAAYAASRRLHEWKLFNLAPKTLAHTSLSHRLHEWKLFNSVSKRLVHTPLPAVCMS